MGGGRLAVWYCGPTGRRIDGDAIPRLIAWAEELRTFGARERGVVRLSGRAVAGRYERRTRPLGDA